MLNREKVDAMAPTKDPVTTPNGASTRTPAKKPANSAAKAPEKAKKTAGEKTPVKTKKRAPAKAPAVEFATYAKAPARTPPAEKSAPAEGRTPVKRRRKRHFPTVFSRLMVLFVVLAAMAGTMYALLRLMNGGAEAAQTAPTPKPTVQPVATEVPAPTPEPTPSDLPDVDLNSWELRLVRYEYPLGEDFAPPELVDVGDGQQMDSRVAPAAVQLIEDAKAAGNTVWVCSGYRDYDTQHIIYWNHIYEYTQEGMTEEEAHAKTRLAVNYPGSSEHQYGLSVDILEYNGQIMEPYICDEPLMVWLKEHCAEYGFVIRYPDNKTDITGVEYEPWHLRYVGTEAAAYMMEHDLCLEEFRQLYEP